ncbi:MAG: RnfABCDGE type electron transport complex subunit G [Hungatella sp.]
MKKGGFMKDALILFAITLISGTLLGAVYSVTKDPIEKASMAASLATYQEVYADAADFKSDQALQDAADKLPEALAAAGLELGAVELPVALNAVDASGTVVGHIFSVTTKEGYGGDIQLSVGVTLDGTVTGIGFLQLSETPGLGMNATNPKFKDQFSGKKAESLVLTKGGASADNEIDAMSGATITSTAVTNAVNAVLYFAKNCIPQS